MTEQKPNCGNCSLATIYGLDATKIATYNPNQNPYPHVYTCKERRGKWMQADDVCLSHPQAREYLMAPVIEELERRSNYDRTAYVPANIRKTVLEECIALIKGVE